MIRVLETASFVFALLLGGVGALCLFVDREVAAALFKASSATFSTAVLMDYMARRWLGEL